MADHEIWAINLGWLTSVNNESYGFEDGNLCSLLSSGNGSSISFWHDRWCIHVGIYAVY